MAKMAEISAEASMKTMSAREAKNSFGVLLDAAQAGPVQVQKHGRPVAVVMSVEEYRRLSRQDVE